MFDHLRDRGNCALLLSKVVETGSWAHAFVGTGIAGHHCVSIKEVNYVLPLWLYPKNSDGLLSAGGAARKPNIAPDFLAALTDGLGRGTPSPDDVFAYIYAVLYAPGYRARYADFLRRDFPHVSMTGDRRLFQRLAGFGHMLIDLHLLRDGSQPAMRYPVPGDNHVGKICFKPTAGGRGQGRVYINAEQYFDEVPEPVWNYVIGSYQVAHKWLNDLKGRVLSEDDIARYQKIVVALSETIRLMQEIDEVIEEHGGWPGAFASSKTRAMTEQDEDSERPGGANPGQ